MGTNTVMGSPHILHTLQLLPLLNPASAYNTAQLARNSILCNSTMEQYDAQSMLRIAHHDRSTPSVCGGTGAGIDLNQLPPSSESADELTRQAPPLLLHTTGASANARNRTSSDLGPGPIHPEPTMISYFEHERSHSNIALRACGDGDGALNARKPLRLSKEKSAVLERSFKEHNTLNPKQKIALANQLNLRPRQVEVWFQNRRARTKLKQKEVECEALKRLCEVLSKENKQLQKEIVELRTLTMGGHCMSPHGFYMPLPRTTSSSCECRSPQFLVASATSTTTSRSSFNQPSNIPSSLSSHQKSSPSCS